MADNDVKKEAEKVQCTHLGGFSGVGQNLIPTQDGYLVVHSVVCQMCGLIFTNATPLQGVTVKKSPIIETAPGVSLRG